MSFFAFLFGIKFPVFFFQAGYEIYIFNSMHDRCMIQPDKQPYLFKGYPLYPGSLTKYVSCLCNLSLPAPADYFALRYLCFFGNRFEGSNHDSLFFRCNMLYLSPCQVPDQRPVFRLKYCEVFHGSILFKINLLSGPSFICFTTPLKIHVYKFLRAVISE